MGMDMSNEMGRDGMEWDRTGCDGMGWYGTDMASPSSRRALTDPDR